LTVDDGQNELIGQPRFRKANASRTSHHCRASPINL
jgi:hypothetical protein